jgi:translation initiation factor IF-3
MALLKRVEADLEDYGLVEQFPKMEGRQMVMVLSPNKKPKQKAKPAKTKEIKEESKEEVE